MRDSAVVMTYTASTDELDELGVLELGLAIMLDKPIMVVRFGKDALPVQLQRVARWVIDVEDRASINAPEVARQVAAAMGELLDDGDSSPRPVPGPWDNPDATPPDPKNFLASEQFVAGALSTLPPFASHHPAWCLPFARRALQALSEWDPSDE